MAQSATEVKDFSIPLTIYLRKLFVILRMKIGLTARLIRTGNRFRDRRLWRAAAEKYRQALERSPTLGPIWVQYGHALKEDGDRPAAEAAYRRAMSAGLDNADVHLQLGHVLKLQGKTAEAKASYLEAFRRDSQGGDALTELSRLGSSRSELRRILGVTPRKTSDDENAPKAAAKSMIAFDISDIIHFIAGSRRPTGIQRVQLHVIGALLDHPTPNNDVILVAFSFAANSWIEIDASDFREIAALMRKSGGYNDADWRLLVRRLTLLLAISDDAKFSAGARLINLGSSWAIGNYFLAVRAARAKHGVIYIPLIHDCIPILAPDYFIPETQRDFRAWMPAVLDHADGFLANSQATASDFQRVATALGFIDKVAQPVPLNALFVSDGSGSDDKKDAKRFLRNKNLAPRGYILFVASIEPRKNHLMVFDAWLKLIAARGADRTPALVCVGGRGWRNRAAMQRLESSEELKSKVLLLKDVSDDELDCLYEGCRFTIYPSSYEGWGLPITESLSKGRLPLVARTSSLPEAGGAFAEYFDLANPSDFLARLERLLDDDGLVQQREAMIAEKFKPRSWSDIASEILARSLEVTASSKAGLVPHRLPDATFVRFGRDVLGVRPSGVQTGEPFRWNSGWCEPGDSGCFLKSPLPAELTFTLDNARGDEPARFTLYLFVHGQRVQPSSDPELDDGSQHWLVVRLAGASETAHRVDSGEKRWIAAPLGTVTPGSKVVISLQVVGHDGAARNGEAIEAIGMYLCREDDLAARHRFVEGVALGALDRGLLAFGAPVTQVEPPIAGRDGLSSNEDKLQ